MSQTRKQKKPIINESRLMRTRNIILILIALTLSNSISAQKRWSDIDYVGDGQTGHKLDIYTPDDGQPTHKVVVLIYGSAWFSNNSKTDAFKAYGQQLLDAGFAVVSINHRASTEARFPAQIQDVKAAIRYVRGNGPKYGLDTSFIGITGYSSGGHLSSLAGTTNGVKTRRFGKVKVDIEEPRRRRGRLVWPHRHEPHGALRDI